MSKTNATVSVGDVRFGNDAPLAVIAGPCQLESRQHAFDMAGSLKELAGKLGFGLVYKTSYDKANRTSLSGRRGAGLEAAMPIFDDLRSGRLVRVLSGFPAPGVPFSLVYPSRRHLAPRTRLVLDFIWEQIRQLQAELATATDDVQA